MDIRPNNLNFQSADVKLKRQKYSVNVAFETNQLSPIIAFPRKSRSGLIRKPRLRRTMIASRFDKRR